MLLVTGITGHTGRYFLQELIKNDYKGKIRCLVRKSSKTDYLKNSGLNLELVTGDLNDQSFLDKIMKDVTEVLHIYNIHHSPFIIESAIKNRVKRVILVHTTGIYSQFKSASSNYIRIESEVIEKAKNKIDLTILRPTMIYGDMCDHNMSKFIKMIDNMKIYPLINRGQALIQPVNARDLGKAYYEVIMNPITTSNKQYDLSGEKPISLGEVLRIISYKLGKKTIFISVPMKVSIFFAHILKISTFGKVDIIEQVLRMGEDRAYSHDLAKKDFNYTPMSFEKGIIIEINQYKKGFNGDEYSNLR